MVAKIQRYHQDCVDAFRMECSIEDIRNNPEAKKLAKYINFDATVEFEEEVSLNLLFLLDLIQLLVHLRRLYLD